MSETVEDTFGRVRAALKERANAPQGLTHSLDSGKEGLAVNATRTAPVILDVGSRHGRWTVASESDQRDRFGARMYICTCDCGRSRSVRASALRSGQSRSCGCSSADAQVTHGMSRSAFYGVWRGMLDRTENPKHSEYDNYGGRGIQVCARWHLFQLFALDMASGYQRGKQLDRIDNDGDYEPANCRWTDHRSNQRNKRSNHRVTWHGRTLIVQEWAEILGINANTIVHRRRRGWPVDRALSEGAEPDVLLELANQEES